MNGINRITARIAEDAKKENEASINKAKADAGVIINNYKLKAQEQTANVAPKAEQTAAERTERRLAVAAMEARKLELGAKQRIISKAFDEAGVMLTKLDDTKKVKWLASLAAQASSGGGEAVVLSKADHEKIGGKVVKEANKLLGDKGKLTLAENAGAFEGGLVLSDGDIEVNCTTSVLLDAARDTLSSEIAKILFAG